MRRLPVLIAALLLAAAPAFAKNQPDLKPAPAVPLEMAPFDASLEPEVTISEGEGDRKFIRESMGSPEISVATWFIGTF